MLDMQMQQGCSKDASFDSRLPADLEDQWLIDPFLAEAVKTGKCPEPQEGSLDLGCRWWCL